MNITHETINERVSVISGQFKYIYIYILDGQEGIANPGDSLIIPNNTIHDWSNAATTEDVHVIFGIYNKGGVTGTTSTSSINDTATAATTSGVNRFEEMIGTIFGLARDGKTSPDGTPDLLQIAAITKEYSDVIRFTNPPIFIQKVLFDYILSPIATSSTLWGGPDKAYKACYPDKYYPGCMGKIDDNATTMKPLPDYINLQPPPGVTIFETS